MNNHNIGNIIKQARKKKGLTQSELGELMGITAVTVGQWETGKRIPKEETIERISEALEIDLTHSVKSVISEMEFRLGSMEKSRMNYKGGIESCEEYQTWIKLLCTQSGPEFL